MLFRSVFIVAIVAIVASTPALAQLAPKGPEPATLKANAEMAKSLPFADRQDFEAYKDDNLLKQSFAASGAEEVAEGDLED